MKTKIYRVEYRSLNGGPFNLDPTVRCIPIHPTTLKAGLAEANHQSKIWPEFEHRLIEETTVVTTRVVKVYKSKDV